MVLNLKNYIASKEDLQTVEEGIKCVWNKRLNFIFKDKSKISQTAVVSYDSQYIYLWQKEKYYKISHKLKVDKKFQLGWVAGLQPENISDYLPNSIKAKTRFEVPIISGGLLGPFIGLQRRKERPNNPYTTRESYLATIIHEFGHVYWNQHKLWWHSNKEENLRYLEEALKAFCGKEVSKLKLIIPSPFSLSEIFAFCVEYFASEVFFKEHRKNIDKFYSERIRELIKFEKNKNLDKDISVLDMESHHDLAATLGVLILKYYPKSWPQKIFAQQYFS